MAGLWISQGYYPRLEFYEPDPIDHSPTMPDPRTSLKWLPSLLTDDKGKTEIVFSNSDVCAEFMGAIEAIDDSGLLGYQTFNFKVIKNK